MAWRPPQHSKKEESVSDAYQRAVDVIDSERQQSQPRRNRGPPKTDELTECLMNLTISDKNDLGHSGHAISLLTNFFDIEPIKAFIVHQYCVDFSPEVQRRKNRLLMLNKLRASFLPVFAYDGRVMFVPRLLQSDEPNNDSTDEKQKSDIVKNVQFQNKEYEITFKYTNKVTPGTHPYIQVMGILLKDKLLKLGMRIINHNLYEMGNEHRVKEEGIYVFPGVKSNIAPRGVDRKLSLCIDKLHKIVNSSTLDEYMYSFERWDEHDKEECKRFLVGQSVVTRYNMRSYRIDDVDYNLNIDSTFESKGRKISYSQYYLEHYNEKLKCKDLPLLAVRSRQLDGSRGFVYLVPELCHLSGVNTGIGGNLNIMRSLAKHCNPVSRMKYIKNVLSRIFQHARKEEAEMGIQWGIKISPEPMTIKARTLDPILPTMEMSRPPRQWPQACSSQMLKSLPLENWIVLHSRNTDANGLLNGIWDTLNKLGMSPKQPIIEQLKSDSPRSVHEALVKMRDQNLLKQNQIVLFVQQDRTLDKNYKEVKKLMCESFGLSSQFVKGKNCRSKPAVFQKIALQMGCKIGCEPWGVNIPFKKPTMIIGIDSYHSRGSASVAAFIATINRYCTKHYSRCCIQQEGQELVSVMKNFIKSAFDAFAAHNNKRLPEQIIVYRDGVGDGQLGYIKDIELSQFHEKCKEMNPSCKITFIVVKKQGSARFFIKQQNGEIVNPPAGTIVDQTITNSTWRDFYLIPQKVTQGTATPAHFNIIKDEAEFSMEFIQDMTFKLCHMYYNWTGPIRVPSVCQYAHKLAFLVGSCMANEPTSKYLHSILYYL